MPDTVEYDENSGGVYWMTPEEAYIHAEELQLLRRELALLASQYREVTVRYYIYGKSCAQISAELDLSMEMVKYYLFKTRKILKEGVGMKREFGEKSYNPQMFRMDFWGDRSSREYWEIFERKLPGNILLTAYEKACSITELAVELGVASVYLEDEIRILESHEMLRKVGDKYQTNIVIFTDAYETCVQEKIRPVYESAAHRFGHMLEAKLPELRKLMFYGNDYDGNRLRWTFANLALYHAMIQANEMTKERFGVYPLLSNGTHGYIYGYDNDYQNHHFHGVFSKIENADKTAWIAVINYRLIASCQKLSVKNWKKATAAMTDAALFRYADEDNDEVVHLIEQEIMTSTNGRLLPRFPVFSETTFERVKEELAFVIREAYTCMSEICDIAAENLRNYVPKALRDKCDPLAYIHYQTDTMAFIMETLVEKGFLRIPQEKTNLGIFGVSREYRHGKGEAEC